MIHKFHLIERILLNKDIIPHPFADATINAGLTRALTASAKLGLTGALSPTFQGVSALAQSCEINEKGCRLLLDCLEALGYVEHRHGEFRFSKRGLKHLDPQAANTFHWFILFGDLLFRSFDNLEHTIREGAPKQKYYENYGDAEWEIYSRAMAEIARNNIPEISRKVKLPKQASKLLDLGGNHGLYSIALCRLQPQLQAVVLDGEPVRKYTDEYISKAQMQTRVHFQAGDFLQDQLPGGQDVVLLFNIIHMFGEAENINLLQRIGKALNPGGQVLVFDQINGVGSRSQLARAMTSYMALNLFHQANGNTYSFDNVQNWASQTGYSSCSLSKLRVPGFGLVTCTK